MKKIFLVVLFLVSNAALAEAFKINKVSLSYADVDQSSLKLACGKAVDAVKVQLTSECLEVHGKVTGWEVVLIPSTGTRTCRANATAICEADL